ncbi:hypothetical protein L207DRAFT_566375 [Hyaloscypha variabilis F]|uniref:C2H2-type domain-containing protein n=1 Tax=Hyaloscypha variabilis (strain UAMH 11265 / GT02V1 / F) TaxID=1149755 RepID=A0A2J6RLH9_HYAVF|nr:hypothetical protein L207DRAFT_566375 [Hyaloscypha variabilis F]
MDEDQRDRRVSNNEGLFGNDDDFIHFKKSCNKFPTQPWQFSQPQGEFARHDQSTGMVDSSRPHGPRHKRQRSSPDVAQESPLPQILGLLSKASQEDKEKIIAVLREQDQPLIPSNFPSSSSEGFPDQYWVSSSNSDHGLSSRSRNPQINASGARQQIQPDPPEWIVKNHSTSEDLHLLDGTIDPALLSSNVNSRLLHNYMHTSRASMPLPDAPQQAALPQRSHFSAPLPFGNPLTGVSSSSSSGNGLFRQAVHSGIGNMNQDSVASSRSSTLLDSESSTNSRYTSSSSFDDQSAAGARGPSRGAISPFSQPSLPSARGRRPTSSTRKSSRSIPCRHPPCPIIFSREDTRSRHEKQKHNPEVATYTCLFDTCNINCDYDCQVPHHQNPFQDTRIDKMKAHLDKYHDWKLTQADIPDYWTKPFEHCKWGWKCCDCGTDLGSWKTNPRFFVEHFKFCGLRLGKDDDTKECGRGRDQTVVDSPAVLRLGRLMKRLNTEGEEIGNRFVDMRIRDTKTLPVPPKALEVTQEEKEYWG